MGGAAVGHARGPRAPSTPGPVLCDQSPEAIRGRWAMDHPRAVGGSPVGMPQDLSTRTCKRRDAGDVAQMKRPRVEIAAWLARGTPVRVWVCSVPVCQCARTRPPICQRPARIAPSLIPLPVISTLSPRTGWSAAARRLIGDDDGANGQSPAARHAEGRADSAAGSREMVPFGPVGGAAN